MAQNNTNGKMPLFERMLTLDPADVVQPLAMKANALYLALTPTSIAQAATDVGENDTTGAVYDMLRDWKYTEQWAERAILSFRRSESEQQMAAVEWIASLMRTCKSAGDLHHASALLAALQHPAIIRLPEVHDAFNSQLGKTQMQATVDIITKDKAYVEYLQRRLEKHTATTPILRILMDHLRAIARRNSVPEDGKNSKLIRMFASFHGNADEHPSQRIDQFLSFQTFPFESALQKKAFRRRSVENSATAAVAQFLKESYDVGEQTYAQPNLILSLSNRLLPWPEAFTNDTPNRHLVGRYMSSMKLSKASVGRHGSLSADARSAVERSISLSNESPLHSMCQCLWGEDGSTASAKRAALIPVLDDLVMQASQSPSHFPTGEWEAALIESLAILEPEDERSFRLLVIVESTLLNWQFENRVGGIADRLRSTFNELVARFGAVDDVTDVQRLILFSLCSRVSHHVADWRNNPDSPQWSNLKELMQFVIGVVFVEDGPLVFASVDALYDQGRCLDEGLLLICNDILYKALKINLDSSTDSRSHLRKNLAALRSSQAVIKESVATLEFIKSIKAEDRQSELFPAVKNIRRILVESRKSVDHTSGVAARLKNLIPFKSSSSPVANRKEGDPKAKRGSLVMSQSGTIGKLARQALAESIERHRNHRNAPAVIRRISQKRDIRRKSLSEIEQPAAASPPTVHEQQAESPSQNSQTHSTHSRRRSSFPNRIVLDLPAASSSMSDDDVSDSEEDVTAKPQATSGNEIAMLLLQ